VPDHGFGVRVSVAVFCMSQGYFILVGVGQGVEYGIPRTRPAAASASASSSSSSISINKSLYLASLGGGK